LTIPPAFIAGIVPGDIIVGIHGLEGETVPGSVQIIKLLQAESGTEYKLKLLRDTQNITINLQLKELYK